VLKIGLGLVAAQETGGLSLYGAYSGLTNLVSAGGELYGGISGNLAAGERVANYASAYSTVSGAITTLATGNVQYGATASTIEGLALVGVTGGLTSTGTMKAAGALDNAVSAADNGVAAGGLAGIGGCHE
jgi:hypothetical protein